MKYQPKRIAFISEHASPLANLGGVDTGGQNVYVAQLARHLATQGYLVDVFTRKDNEELDDIIEWVPGVRVINVTAGPANNIIKEELLQHMDEFKNNMVAFITGKQLYYSLVHANFFMSAFVAMGIKQELNIPFIVTFHALGHVRRIHQAEQDKFPAERLILEEMAVKYADHIIAECPQDRDDLINYYHAPANKITIVPCGFSDEEFYPINKTAARKMLGLPLNEHIILQLGRMVPRKGIDNVIKALSYITGTDNPVKLVVVGGECEQMDIESCPEYARLLSIAKACNVDDKIIFAGRKNRDQLKFYYAAADLFITTPWYEPFGITPLEAMACGTPVIGSNVGGIKYSVADHETGWLVPPNDAKALGRKISQVIDDSRLLGRISENAIKRVNKYFTWSTVALKVDKLYTGLRYTIGKESKLILAAQEDKAA